MNKKIAIIVATVGILGTGLFAARNAFAQTTTDLDPMSSLVQKISDKFGLNKADVQAVFDQQRQEQQASMQAKYEAHLNQLVTDGKITDAQKALIIAKHNEMQASRQTTMNNFKNLTDAERKSAMEKQHADLETWAKTNGIEIKYLMPFGGFGRGAMHLRNDNNQ